MAEKRARSGKRTRRIEFPPVPEVSKTMAQINAARQDAIWLASYEYAVRIANAMLDNFPDIPAHMTSLCDAYVKRIREALPEDFDGLGEGTPVPAPAEKQDGTDLAGDCLAAAIRAVMPGAPAADADREECDEFVAGLAAARMQDAGERSRAARMIRDAFPDFPDEAGEDACREYLSKLAEAAAKAADAEARLARYERMAGMLPGLMPEECADDPEKAARFEKAVAEHLNGSLDDLRDVVRGALR